MVAGTRVGTMLMSAQTAPAKQTALAKQTPTLKQSKIAESMQAAAKLSPPKTDGPCWPSERRPAIDAVNEAAPPSQPCETNKGVRHFLELSDEQIRKSVEKFETYHEVLIDLGFTPIKQSWNDKLVRFKTNFTETLIKRCIAGNIPSKHLRYRHYGESQKRQQKDGEEQGDADSSGASPTAGKSIHTNQLRQILQDDGREFVCAWCRCRHYTWNKHEKAWTWLGRPFQLEVHHVAGRKIDNPHAASNLELLCPQCHATTENYGNKKRKTEA